MLTFIAGTRPEFVKLRPVAAHLTTIGTPWRLVCTHQHSDLIHEFLTDPFWGTHTLHLHRPRQSTNPIAYAEELASDLHFLLEALAPTPPVVIVQGDTASALAGARAANHLGLPLAHVEAGIRSHDLTNPWPEESFRVEITQLAQWHYAPSDTNHAHLVSEGTDPTRICVTGNPGLDHLALVPRSGVRHSRVLVTLHRRESFGEPFRNVLAGLALAARIHPTVEFLWPVHPNPNVQQVAIEVDLPANVFRLPPLPAAVFQQLLASSLAVLTDSGGVQEEAAFLGIPAVIARTVTDRPESVASGHALLSGTTASSVADCLSQVLTDTLHTDPFLGFGDGLSGPRIAEHLASIAQDNHPQPTP